MEGQQIRNQYKKRFGFTENGSSILETRIKNDELKQSIWQIFTEKTKNISENYFLKQLIFLEKSGEFSEIHN